MKYCSYCGKEIMDEAVICPNCNRSVSSPVSSAESDTPSQGLNIISFFIPIVGLILYLIYHDKAPNKAKAIGKFALIGFVVSLLLIFCFNAFSNYESPEERARRETDEAIRAYERSAQKLEDLQREQDRIQRIIDGYEK